MPFNRKEPYNELPLLPPGKEFYEDIELYKVLARARASLAELKGRSPIIPNPKMLINTIALQEAIDSSTIENIVTSRDKLFKAFSSKNQNADPHTKEVLRYREAMWKAFNDLIQTGKINQDILIKVFQTITQKKEEIRDQQVFIGNDRQIIYTPPAPGKILKDKIANWIKYANEKNELDPLIKMAILHYQFESIHPFIDGNGRTGRIINVLYMTHNNLIDLPILYLSKYILEYKSEYYRLLTEVTEKNNWKNWILFILRAVDVTAKFTLEKVNAIYDLFQEVIDRVRSDAEDIYSYELVEAIFYQPYCRIGILVDLGIASRNTASKYLNKLVKMQILEKQKEGNEFLFLNTKLYKILAST